MKFWIALLLLVGTACCGAKPVISAEGTLDSGTLELRSGGGKIEAFPPEAGQPANRYLVTQSSSGAPPAAATVFNRQSRTVAICPLSCPPPADAPAVTYVVRVPKDVRASFYLESGDIDVSDVSGPVDAVDGRGDIKIQIPSYANAKTSYGNVSVTFGDANWPGALHFSTRRGDVELYVPALANARVDLHTDRGTIFTDFDLRGSANGVAESITGKIGGGGDRSVIVRVHDGNIRVLKLVPQM
ncbi:MAG: hypothetical protein NVSMB31_14160 [Vulcanimicrobiaceae bacterium]